MKNTIAKLLYDLADFLLSMSENLAPGEIVKDVTVKSVTHDPTVPQYSITFDGNADLDIQEGDRLTIRK